MTLLSQALALAIGCGGGAPADPLAGTEAFLRVGLEPAREADLLEARLEEEGYRRRLRIDGRTHSSLALVRPETGETLVRIISRAGVALAVEAPADTGLQAVGLVDLGGDVDGDGWEEVGVYADDPAEARRCVAIVRVDERGRAREVRLDTRELGGDACVEGFEDLDGDGTVEALVVARYRRLSAGTPPRVTIPYRAAGWRPVAGGAARSFARRERRAREEALRAARERSDAREAYRLGVELAAIARFAGETAEAQLAVLDGALRGLRLSTALTETLEEARALIRRGWRDDADDPR